MVVERIAGGVERFPMAGWLRGTMLGAALASMLGIVTIPISLYIIWRVFAARAVIRDDGLTVSWMGLRGWTVRWDEIVDVQLRDVRGGLARQLQPLEIKTAAGKTRVLPVGGFRDWKRILQVMHERGVPGIIGEVANDGETRYGAVVAG